MRLLHTTRLSMVEFDGDDVPPYAILSHRWLTQEVLFRDFVDGRTLADNGSLKQGYRKLKQSCIKARVDGHEWLWIDTCCIDKSSSAELSESINSMFRWYKRAQTCYAFLQDVDDTETTNDSAFAKSVWWTRGWTLQELIAPEEVEFYNSTWQKIGSKRTLSCTISEISGIDPQILLGDPLSTCCIAQRMAWAAERKTTRIEDMAYSLMGLFNVNMPMLYGEGEKAFMRLQQEIMKDSDDQSIFAWRLTENGFHGLLAKSPLNFKDCGDIRPVSVGMFKSPYHFTNMGLRIDMETRPWHMEVYVAALDCKRVRDIHTCIGIFMALLPNSMQFARVRCDGQDQQQFDYTRTPRGDHRRMYIKQDFSDRDEDSITRELSRRLNFSESNASYWLQSAGSDRRLYGFLVQEMNIFQRSCEVRCRMPVAEDRVLQLPAGSTHGTVAVLISQAYQCPTVLKLGFDKNFDVWCQYGPEIDGEPLNTSKYSLDSDLWMNEHNHRAWRIGRDVRKFSKRLRMHSIQLARIFIENRYVWTVQVEEVEPDPRGTPHSGVVCDQCDGMICGTRYKCKVCADFDLCSTCQQSMLNFHKSHEFDIIPDPWEGLLGVPVVGT